MDQLEILFIFTIVFFGLMTYKNARDNKKATKLKK